MIERPARDWIASVIQVICFSFICFVGAVLVYQVKMADTPMMNKKNFSTSSQQREAVTNANTVANANVHVNTSSNNNNNNNGGGGGGGDGANSDGGINSGGGGGDRDERGSSIGGSTITPAMSIITPNSTRITPKSSGYLKKKKATPTKKFLGCITIVQIVLLSAFLIFLKELLSLIDWIFWLFNPNGNELDTTMIFCTNFFFALSLFLLQALFIERLSASLYNSAYEYPYYVYVLLRSMTIPVFFFGVCMAYFEASVESEPLSISMMILCLLMFINTFSVTYLLYRALAKILNRFVMSQSKMLHALIRLTLVSMFALGSTTIMLIAGAVAYQICSFCDATYVYYCLYPIDSCINISCLLFSLKAGEPFYFKVFGKIHDYWFSMFAAKHRASTLAQFTIS